MAAKFTYPPEWSDEERMRYLLSPFPATQLPSSNDQRMVFWRTLILKTNKELKRPVFTERELTDLFQWNGTPPSCLPLVLQAMEKNGEIRRFSEEAVDSAGDQGWLGWGVGVLAKPVAWAWNSYYGPPQYEGKYIMLAAVKELAEEVIAEQQKTVLHDSTDRVVKYGEFVQLCHSVATREAAAAVELYLMQQRKIRKKRTSKGWEIVKFALIGERTVPAITETDIGIVSLKELVKNLSEQVKTTEQKIQKLRQATKEKMRLKDRQGALKCLKQVKMAEKTLNSREMMLNNIQRIMDQIQAAETDATVFQSYRSGVEALKSIKKSQGITAEEAESIMVDLDEAMEANEEITNILSEGVGNQLEDDDELEGELEALLSPPQLPQATSGRVGTTVEDLEKEFAILDIRDADDQTGAGARPLVPPVGSTSPGEKVPAVPEELQTPNRTHNSRQSEKEPVLA